MTLSDFAARYDKTEKTVEGWLNKQLIPGAYVLENTSEWYIPELYEKETEKWWRCHVPKHRKCCC